ncbi:calcitonin gene-related peptide type 1 receptor-like [Varroa jacobsoni]|uniref:calcitonin gene-related peptide type 1 receptor-like n=1 Tax=Varroa jacobsoni TaxID=62625 RepID=UPI000BF42694|nr:calcitonin gene-related peptide type 1 receptor-like [Varroa jacobsoni]XP_022697775.1 calcitonin gene-related peptide type 1 receptor-like [Varroa jacobsoni]XP_022697776.1 calcitonin gene-related peptide type 1 receptor-like [Varroa jacobsoni]
MTLLPLYSLCTLWCCAIGLAATDQNVNLMMRRIEGYVLCHQANDSNQSGCPSYFNGFVCIPPAAKKTDVLVRCLSTGGVARYVCSENGNWVDIEDYKMKCHEKTASGSYEYDNELIQDVAGTAVKVPWEPFRAGEEAEVKQEYFKVCLKEILLAPRREPNTGIYCERHFDGWGCWADTDAGLIGSINCPPFIPGFIQKLKATKVCTTNGTWAYNLNTRRHRWADYSGCVSTHKLRLSEIGVNIYFSGYIVSLIALSFSLAIFFYFRSVLHCVRITIHKNLFASFIINNLCWLAWYIEASKETFLVDNSLTCQLLHVITHYFLLSNYFWMFNEGLYLHTVLVFSFVSEKRLIYYLYLIGWVLPAIIIIAYAVPRALDPMASGSCWTDASTVYTFVLSIPITLSIVVNFLFLINIVRVLWSKLKAPGQTSTSQQESSVPIRAIRATLILLPLLGLHYISTPFRPGFNSAFYEAYEIYSAVTTSFQGLAVAILFCLCNQEVVAQVRRKIQLTSCFKHRYMQCSTNGQPACVQASVHHDQHRASTVGSIL